MLAWELFQRDLLDGGRRRIVWVAKSRSRTSGSLTAFIGARVQGSRSVCHCPGFAEFLGDSCR